MDEPDDTSWVVAREHVAYDLSEWDPAQVEAAFRMLAGAGIPYHWELFELAVPVAHEPATDDILDRIEYPDQLDDDTAGDESDEPAQRMHELFLAADALNRSPSGAIARHELVELAERIHGSPAPYGFNAEWWEQVQLTAALLRRDVLEEEGPQWIAQRAAELRDALRPFV